jgi:hypothetical protein
VEKSRKDLHSFTQADGFWGLDCGSEMGEYLLDHHRIFDAGDDPNRAAASPQVSMSMLNTRLSRYAFMPLVYRSWPLSVCGRCEYSEGRPFSLFFYRASITIEGPQRVILPRLVAYIIHH